MPTSRFSPQQETPGLAVRRVAADIIDNILIRRRPLDEQLDGAGAHPALKTMADRDRALMRRLVATTLRRLGTLRFILSRLLDRGLPSDSQRAETALLLGAAQILWMDVPDHAAVDLSVRLAQADRRAAKYVGLVNAVLRRCAREGHALAAEAAPETPDIPPWLFARWAATYGADTARAVAEAIGHEPALDITVKSDADHWATRLHGELLSTGSIRTMLHGPVTMLPGFDDGSWWVQDAAATLPVRLLGDIKGKRVADFCAAPGGKTAQLIHAGAEVIALDRSPNRIRRLQGNLARLKLEAKTMTVDATEWESGPLDAILIDAPCTATGTIRRHPDIAWLKQESDIAQVTGLQERLLQKASSLLNPGGVIVYCTCSLEPEEGEQMVDTLLAADSSLRRIPVTPSEISGHDELVTSAGDLRTLPSHFPHTDPRLAGLDGFYAARLVKS
jgi:16S rRNA (cytosine967-C5)-methyltransferase